MLRFKSEDGPVFIDPTLVEAVVPSSQKEGRCLVYIHRERGPAARYAVDESSEDVASRIILANQQIDLK